MGISTAGRGDPYWYEWFVGLIEIVEMLDPGTGIESVALQEEGVKGWDDVVVRMTDGRRRCYQVKHTREANNLTFGDLVGTDREGHSLLGDLFSSWRQSGLNDGRTECTLYTNREAGRRIASASDGHLRPALLDFEAWRADAVGRAGSLADMAPPADWEAAWSEWLARLDGAGITDDERWTFLRALRIRAGEDDLDGLERRLKTRLAAIFGTSEERVAPFFDALHRALKKWTTGHPPVTAEHVCSELALPAEERDLAPAPPPPAPFFASRQPFLDELEATLLAADTPPVLFLVAEPGAGKTSVLSRLANRRTDAPFTGLIGLRYFCFEPIRPDAPVIAPDMGRVRPENLWYSLLSQLREGLRGRLREFGVPLRNDLLRWEEARERVLRLAGTLGMQLGRPFVIVVDGIDHAARAAQSGHREALEFFASLPGPDTLRGSPIRLLVAGQPPEQYGDYPAWLRGPHPDVANISLPSLRTGDVRDLCLSQKSGLLEHVTEEVVRLIESCARGNTLATVFAVAEAAQATSLAELEDRLANRRLHDGLEHYYGSIWTYAIASAGDSGRAVESDLAGALCLARHGIAPEMLAAAFPEWNLPAPWWRGVLNAFGPILVEAADGFRVRHNDVRLFLAARFSAHAPNERRDVASRLADYYRLRHADRGQAHRAVFPLLELAGRRADAARLFTAEWVAEAASVDIGTDQLSEEGCAALAELPNLRNWDLVLSVACALQTLSHLQELEEIGQLVLGPPGHEMPPFLPTEARIRPRDMWTAEDFASLVSDAFRLVEAGESGRARALLDRWLGGMSVCGILAKLHDIVAGPATGSDDPLAYRAIEHSFARLGRLARRLKWVFPLGEPTGDHQHRVGLAYERGYVEAAGADTDARTPDECLGGYEPIYVASWEALVSELAGRERWDAVRALLVDMAGMDCSRTFRVQAAWWALCSGAAEETPHWLKALEQPPYGLDPSRETPFGSYICVAKAMGWQSVAAEPGDVADVLYAIDDPEGRRADSGSATRLVLRAAALVGRILGVAKRSGWSAASQVVSEKEIRSLLSALWSPDVLRNVHFEHRSAPAQIADELASVCPKLGERFDAVALEAAEPHASAFPIDYRQIGLWRVCARHGARSLLCGWARHWLDRDGKLWKLAPAERRETVAAFDPLVRELGEESLIDEALERLRLSRVGYLSEDRSFGEAVRWLAELCDRKPEAWKEEGWQLLSLSAACEQQECGNNFESEIEEVTAAAALGCGPSDLWRLLSTTIADAAEAEWHYETRNRIGGGFARALRTGANLSVRERLILWCLVVAFSRWFDDADIRVLAEVRAALQASCASAEQWNELLQELRRLTPGEAQREPERDRERGSTEQVLPDPGPDYSLDPVLAKVAEGLELLPSEAAVAVRSIVRSGHTKQRDLIPTLLRAVGTGHEFAVSWAWDDKFSNVAVSNIAKDVGDAHLWALVQAAVSRPRSERRSWSMGIADNLHQIAFARARARGEDSLRTGLAAHIRMHRLWAFGLGWDRPTPELPKTPNADGWDQVVIRFLPILVGSRSAEVVSSAVTAMHAFVALEPRNITHLFRVLRDEWPRQWLLNSAESWAALHPEAMEVVRPELEQHLKLGPLASRLQAWIVLCKLADVRGRERPEFPLPSDVEPRHVALPRSVGGILTTGAVARGAINLTDRHESALRKLDRLRACGFDFRSQEPTIAAAILDSPREGEDSGGWRRTPRRHGDFYCTPDVAERAVGAAIDEVLSARQCPQEAVSLLAQGLLDSEDPWILRQTPLPSPTPDDWPTENDIGAWTNLADSQGVLERMRRLALEHAIPDGWHPVAARVQLATWREDLILFTWLEGQLRAVGTELATKCPSCPSGRTFLWWLGDHFEPSPPNGVPIMGFLVGGSQRLWHSFLEIQPSKLWRCLGWQPDQRNPLLWLKDNKVIAKYQQIHGPPRTANQGPHCRQPILDRWIMTSAALSIAEKAAGSFQMREEFLRVPSDFER